jgi:hypothetical protein
MAAILKITTIPKMTTVGTILKMTAVIERLQHPTVTTFKSHVWRLETADLFVGYVPRWVDFQAEHKKG